MDTCHRATAFGLGWRSDIALPGFDPGVGAGEIGAPVTVTRVNRLPGRGDGRAVGRGAVYPDGIRFDWEDEVRFAMTGGDRIAYVPGPDWTGTMPASFGSTVAALTAAWRGLVPLHASAVAVDGHAVLIAGKAGAGKSTLAAGLVAAGAGFFADDLTVISVEGHVVGVTRGRPTMRLHPDTAARLETLDAGPVADDPRGKWLVRPARREADVSLPLGAVLLLLPGEEAAGQVANPIALLAHLFRPRWIGSLPMRERLMANVLAIAARVPVLGFPAMEDVSAGVWRNRAEQALAIVRTASRS